MNRAWTETARLVTTNARHRKGWRLGDAPLALSLTNAREELRELEQAPGEIQELADVFGCLIVYAVKQGWSAAEVEFALLHKMALRFTEGEAS